MKDEKLIMTLVVKDEAEIIERNISHHYSQGVDFVLVADNGSTDGTLRILKKLERKSLIKLFHIRDYIQDKVVNGLGQIAFEEHGATILIHNDADEFWVSSLGDLKQSFLDEAEDTLLVDRKNIIPQLSAYSEPFPQDKQIIIHGPADISAREIKQNIASLFFAKLQPKCMLSVRTGARKVSKGNHRALDRKNTAKSRTMKIYHFPYQSYARFQTKVQNAVDFIEKHNIADESYWHWQKWRSEKDRGQIQQLIQNSLDPGRLKAPIRFSPFKFDQELPNAKADSMFSNKA